MNDPLRVTERERRHHLLHQLAHAPLRRGGLPLCLAQRPLRQRAAGEVLGALLDLRGLLDVALFMRQITFEYEIALNCGI